jgi:hypothetical protein
MVSPLTGVEALLLAGTGAAAGALLVRRLVRWPSPVVARASGRGSAGVP